ncbi:hypothetical protein [Cereibacter azotoformans]|uniref:Uncharacterized protein n=1 Tax=Cereibacter azotoformans TaxID=43057 RepID=A0A2T5K726_9RHOB|nr:hypothetical protein [Cereibacter azotoformans]MBO4169544.1 hypothetical protein [Cereibacter azotoformans]PTR18221.1 hypothetical protein C8J28_109181 [Cereibacter azotoformans]
MTPKIRVAEDQDHRPLPVGRFDSASAINGNVGDGPKVSFELSPGRVYCMTSDLAVEVVQGSPSSVWPGYHGVLVGPFSPHWLLAGADEELHVRSLAAGVSGRVTLTPLVSA